MQGIERRRAILSAREGYIPDAVLVDTDFTVASIGWVLFTSWSGNASASTGY